VSETVHPGAPGAAHAGILEAVHHGSYSTRKLGMWLFLFTELLLFGGLFIVYAVNRHAHSQDFHTAALDLNVVLGTANTLVLLTSSLSMALSITALQKGNRKLSVGLVLFTVLCAFAFLVVKYFEWSAKIQHGIYPNSPELLKLPTGEVQFFGLYYAMTGLHAVHVLIGIVLLLVMAALVHKKPFDVHSFRPGDSSGLLGARVGIRDRDGSDLWQDRPVDDTVERVQVTVFRKPGADTIRPADYVGLENAGLYWHVVDIIWIFLFPLFYLIT